MTKDEIKQHTHYKPHGYTVVCGFRDVVVSRQGEPDTPEYPLSLISGTTVLQKITCPGCRTWVRSVVNKW